MQINIAEKCFDFGGYFEIGRRKIRSAQEQFLGGKRHIFTLRSKLYRGEFRNLFPFSFYDNLKVVKFAIMPIFMIFMNSEINKIDLEALLFRIFRIPTVKF